MSLFSRRDEEQRERSAAERERARLERERRRAAREGRPLPPEPEPAAGPPPDVEPPPPAAPEPEPPAAQAPPAPEPPPAPAPPPPAPEPPPPPAPEPPAPEPEPERPATRAPADPPDQIEHAAGLPLSIDPEFGVPRVPTRMPETPPQRTGREAGSWFDEDEEEATQVRTAPAQQPPAPAPPPAPTPPAGAGRSEATGEFPPAAPERPLGTRRVRAPSVSDLPRVADAPPRPVPGRSAPKPRRGMRRLAGLVALAAIAAAAWFAVSLWQPFAADEGEGRVRVTVPQGATIGEIGDLLAEREVVGSSFFFALRARLAGTNLKSGTFVLRRDMSYSAALDTLERNPPPPPVVRITIPEGRSRREVAPLVRDAGLRGSYMDATRRTTRLSLRRLGAPRGTDTLEGFLYPATYELKPGSSVRRLVAQQLQAFERALEQVDLRAARRRNLSAYEVVTIASMIEREASVPRDRRLISAVIHNRLRQHMPLGIDATIRYRLNQWTRPLRVSELETDSAFNTRKRQGLPPTPIGNPGLPSLRAAARPANVDFVYYVVKPCGNGAHAFSSTDAEFQRDVAAYNRARERRGGRDPSRC